jgi:monovalent cation:H+ antiporter-2, CPA2 family
MQIELLKDVVIILGLSAIVLFVCHRLRVPVIVGYLFTGLLAGPHVLGVIKDQQAVQVLAEVGVVLLLFTIGLEFSLRSLLNFKKVSFLGGTLQVVLTLLAGFIVARGFGWSLSKSIFIGFLACLSSTAIVMKILQDRAEVETPHGNTSLGILIFQDIAVVPMMLAIPLLAGTERSGGPSLLLLLAGEVAIIPFLIVCAKWVVPWIFFRVSQTKSRELFLLTVVVMCLAVAWLTHSLGLSLALGAFLAGLTISESEYSQQALGNILPFQDVFASFFFVSVGMLLDLSFFVQRPGLLVMMATGLIAIKAVLAGLAVLLVGLPLRTVILVGLSLGQIGEFSFVLSETGGQYGLLDSNSYQIFLAVSILTMMATPFIMTGAPRTAQWALKLHLPARLKRGAYPVARTKRVTLKDHVVIVGYGINGRNLARAAKASSIPYVVLDINPMTVRQERKKGEPIYYGDATQEAVLHHVNLRHAKAVAVVINDPPAARRITELSRRLNPRVYIIVRTRFVREMEPLRGLGADEVIPEEFETSVEIFSRVLGKYLLPKDEIEKFISEVRLDGYGMFRSLAREATTCSDLRVCLPDAEISSFRIAEGSSLTGKTIEQIGLRKRYGVVLLALRRDTQILSAPGADTTFQTGDILFVVGPSEKLRDLAPLFRVEPS